MRASQDADAEDMDDLLLAADDAAEEVDEGNDGDAAMDSDPDDELELHSDAAAYFDQPRDSLFAIAQHPLVPALVAVGGAAGPADDAPGAAWLLDASPARPPPAAAPVPLRSLRALDGHSDSVNALCWTLPRGEVLVSAGLDGRLRAWRVAVAPAAAAPDVALLAEAREVDEINWLAPCPQPASASPNLVAFGASDGSVWVYSIAPADAKEPLRLAHSFFLHTASCTAGAWDAEGSLLATVAEDASLHVWAVTHHAAASGLVGDNGLTVVSLTAQDQRFAVDGGLYSVAFDPKGAFVAVGGAGGVVKIVSLPRALPGSDSQASGPAVGGQILASLHAQSDSIETLSMTLTAGAPETVLLAAGSVDGSIVVYDATRRFAVRRHMPAAHGEHAVVRVEFVPASWLLTSCGMDGVVRRWDLRAGGATGSDTGLLKEWRGHRGDGQGGGVLGFVQGKTGERVVTAGDDGLALVFDA